MTDRLLGEQEKSTKDKIKIQATTTLESLLFQQTRGWVRFRGHVEGQEILSLAHARWGSGTETLQTDTELWLESVI